MIEKSYECPFPNCDKNYGHYMYNIIIVAMIAIQNQYQLASIREISVQGKGDGTAPVVVNQLWVWLFNTCKNIFQFTNSQFYSRLITAHKR